MTRGDFMIPVDRHRECWDLLPWLANERAAPQDVARIESHLRECTQCQRELQAQRCLRETIRSAETIALAPQTSLQKLMQRIDATPEAPRSDVHSSEPAEEIAAGARRVSRRWRRLLPVAAAVQAVAMTGLLAALWWQDRESLTAPRFTTLTTQTAVTRGPVIRVVFMEGIALDEVNELLRSIDAQIITGPSEAGVYALSLASPSAHPSDIENALSRLRADGRVVFAEAAQMQAGSR